MGTRRKRPKNAARMRLEALSAETLFTNEVIGDFLEEFLRGSGIKPGPVLVRC
jgi:hypothetical protein